MNNTFGYNNIHSNQSNLSDKIRRAMYDTVRESGIEAVGEIQARTPVDTGDLKRSMTCSKPEITETTVSVKVGSSLSYAQPVEEGHKQDVGRYVPAIGKKLVKPYVQGKFMIHTGLGIEETKLSKKFLDKLGDIND